MATVLIGLDDLGAAPFRFIGELSGCQLGNALAHRVRSCQTLPAMTAPALGGAVSQAGRNLASSLAWLHRHRPTTRVLVLDYPAVLGAEDCSADDYLVASDVVLYRSVLDRLNAVLRADRDRRPLCLRRPVRTERRVPRLSGLAHPAYRHFSVSQPPVDCRGGGSGHGGGQSGGPHPRRTAESGGIHRDVTAGTYGWVPRGRSLLSDLIGWP